MSEITHEQVLGLRAAVAAGTGLTGWHGGIADSFRASVRLPAARRRAVRDASEPDPSQLVEGSEENNYLPYTVEHHRPRPASIRSPQGIDDFELTTEQYWVLHDDLIDVLATTTHPVQPWHPWHRPITSPAIWTRLVGRRPDRRDDTRAQPRHPRGPERPHRHREGHAVGDPHRIGIVGLGRHLPAVPRDARRHPVGRASRPSPTSTRPRAAAVAAELPGAEALSVDELLGEPRRRHRPQPDDPRRARRDRARGDRERQAGLRREAARGHVRAGARDGRCSGCRGRRARRLRARHRAGHRHADRAGGDRRRA